MRLQMCLDLNVGCALYRHTPIPYLPEPSCRGHNSLPSGANREETFT